MINSLASLIPNVYTRPSIHYSSVHVDSDLTHYFNSQASEGGSYTPLGPTQAPINPPYKTACELKRTAQLAVASGGSQLVDELSRGLEAAATLKDQDRTTEKSTSAPHTVANQDTIVDAAPLPELQSKQDELEHGNGIAATTKMETVHTSEQKIKLWMYFCSFQNLSIFQIRHTTSLCTASINHYMHGYREYGEPLHTCLFKC